MVKDLCSKITGKNNFSCFDKNKNGIIIRNDIGRYWIRHYFPVPLSSGCRHVPKLHSSLDTYGGTHGTDFPFRSHVVTSLSAQYSDTIQLMLVAHSDLAESAAQYSAPNHRGPVWLAPCPLVSPPAEKADWARVRVPGRCGRIPRGRPPFTRWTPGRPRGMDTVLSSFVRRGAARAPLPIGTGTSRARPGVGVSGTGTASRARVVRATCDAASAGPHGPPWLPRRGRGRGMEPTGSSSQSQARQGPALAPAACRPKNIRPEWQPCCSCTVHAWWMTDWLGDLIGLAFRASIGPLSCCAGGVSCPFRAYLVLTGSRWCRAWPTGLLAVVLR